jgi:hypothetical protein
MPALKRFPIAAKQQPKVLLGDRIRYDAANLSVWQRA